LAIGILVGLVAFIFNPVIPAHFFILFFAALATSSLFSLLGFANAFFAKSFEDISIVPTFILTPLVYLGGVFYSINQLSPFWKKICLLNPIAYIIDIFRYGFLGIGSTHLFISLLVLILLIIIFFSLNLYWLNKGIRLKS
jgi:ABC-2 type transport system permease protein